MNSNTLPCPATAGYILSGKGVCKAFLELSLVPRTPANKQDTWDLCLWEIIQVWINCSNITNPVAVCKNTLALFLHQCVSSSHEVPYRWPMRVFTGLTEGENVFSGTNHFNKWMWGQSAFSGPAFKPDIFLCYHKFLPLYSLIVSQCECQSTFIST